MIDAYVAFLSRLMVLVVFFPIGTYAWECFVQKIRKLALEFALVLRAWVSSNLFGALISLTMRYTL